MRQPKPEICVDIDNVLAQTDSTIRRIIYERTKGRVRLEYEDIVEFDYWRCRDKAGSSITKKQWGAVHKAFSKKELLSSVEPVPNARESLATLAVHANIHIATSRLPAARGATITWLRSHGFAHTEFHTVEHRKKHAIPVDFLAIVEDDYAQAELFRGLGTRVFLIEHPWNRGRPKREHITWVSNWEELTRRLLVVFG